MLLNYFKVAFRSLWRRKTFSLINILGLAVGITACFLIFMYVRFETSFDNFHTKADRIYRIVDDVITPTETIHSGLSQSPIAINVKKDFPEVEDAVRITPESFLVRIGDKKYQEDHSVLADSTLFNIFDFPLIAGDKKTALRDPMSIVLSESFAKKYFGKEDAMGKQVLLSGKAIPSKVTGIMKDIPANSQIVADMFVSISSWQQLYDRPTSDSEWTNHNHYAFLLLKPHTNAKSLEAKFPDFMERHDGRQMKELQMYYTLFLEPLRDIYLKSKRGGMVNGSMSNVYIFSVIAIFILVIACINFINLTTARSAERAKEVGIRKVVGAVRSQLARQFLSESVVICLLSFVIAIALCAILLPLFNNLAGQEISKGIFSQPLAILSLFLFTIALGAIAGLYPSLVLSSFKPVSVLKGRFSTGSKGMLLRRILVVSQFTISIVLIIATIVVYKQINYMRNQELGFSKDQQVVIFTNYDKNKDVFKQSLSDIPGVKSTTFSVCVPGGDPYSAYTKIQNKKGEMQQMNIDYYSVDFDFINQFGLKMVAGRPFSREFTTDTGQAMILNEAAAKMLGYGTPQESIGRKFAQWGREGTIIGVLKNFHSKSLQTEIKPMVMRIEPYGWGTISIKVDAANLPKTLAAIEAKWKSNIPNRPFQYEFLDESFNKQYRSEERFGKLFFNFAVLAIFISCLGLLGLASYSTILRTREIGVRKVLGASVSSIVNLLSVDFIKQVLIAFAIAIPVAWWGMTAWLNDFSYRTQLAWWVFAAAGITAVLIAFCTISFQAIRAAIENPVKSLRTE